MFKKTTLLTVALTLTLGAAMPATANAKGETDKQSTVSKKPVSKTGVSWVIRPKKVEW